jgi:drug/metabolite transporter (DMT)-like permease
LNQINNARAQTALLIAVILYGTAFVAIRYVSEYYSAGAMSLLRFLVASFCMYFVYRLYPHKKKPTLLEVAAIFGVGMLNITIYSLALNEGEKTVAAALASFIVSQTPVLVTIAAIWFFKERIKKWGYVGFIISFIGVTLILASGAEKTHFNLGILLVVIALLVNSAYIILQKPLLKKFHPIELTTYFMWSGTIPLLFFTPNLIHEIQFVPMSATWMVIYLGIFPSAMGYMLFNYAYTHMPASQATASLYLIPFFALIFGWIFLREMPADLALIGGVVAVIGAYFITKNVERKI